MGKRPTPRKPFWTHLLVLLSVVAEVEARFGLFGDNANLRHDRCSVCAERTIGSEIVWDAHDGTARRRGSCGISFWSVWKRCNCWC
jgi:hypothetical protein